MRSTPRPSLVASATCGLTWPRPWGPGLTSEHQRVFNEEAAGYELPTGVFTIGLGMCAPTLLEFGSEEQKQHVAKMLRGDEVGALLAQHLLGLRREGVYATSIVSSPYGDSGCRKDADAESPPG